MSITNAVDRRHFLVGALTGLGALAAGCQEEPRAARPEPVEPAAPPVGPLLLRRPYTGPNVVVIRFDGGVRRPETIATPDAPPIQ